MDWLDWVRVGAWVLLLLFGGVALLVIWVNLRAFKKGPPDETL